MEIEKGFSGDDAAGSRNHVHNKSMDRDTRFRRWWMIASLILLVNVSCGNDPGVAISSTQPSSRQPTALPEVVSKAEVRPETTGAPPALPGDAGTSSPNPENGSSTDPRDAGVPRLKPGQKLTWKEVLGLDGHHSTSFGSVSAGDARLEGGIRFPNRGPGFVLGKTRPNRGGRYTTVEVAQAMIRAARRVHRKYPPGKLRIHDFSLREGGKIPHHGSHRNGRDVDVMFYLLDKEAEPVLGKGIVIDPEGKGTDFGDLGYPGDDLDYTLDVERTWELLEALVRDKRAHLQRIFVVEHVRTLLMAYAEKNRRPKKYRRLIGHLTCQPFTPHDDHIHLRFFCSPEDVEQGCTEMHPIYPWQKSFLEGHQIEPVLSIPKRYTKKKGKKKGYQMPPLPENAHLRVQELWKRRARWAQKPRAGRSYCP